SDVGRTVEQVGLLPRAISLGLARRNGNGFRFSPEQNGELSLRIELDDHVGHLIHYPNVVVRIDADLGGEHEAVRVLADLADELAVLVELATPRAAMGEGTRGADRDRGMAGSRVDENIAARIRRHTAHFAE